MTQELASALSEVDAGGWILFAQVARDSLSGARDPFENNKVAWIDLDGPRRAFLYKGLWVEATEGAGTLSFDLADVGYVRDRAMAAINEVLEEMEAMGALRRIGMRNGQVVWTKADRS